MRQPSGRSISELDPVHARRAPGRTLTKERVMTTMERTVNSVLIGLLLTAAACGGEDDAGSSGPSLPERLQTLNQDLTIGSTGDDVRAVHEYLTRYGYFPNAQLAHDFPSWRPLVKEPPADLAVFDRRTADAVSA